MQSKEQQVVILSIQFLFLINQHSRQYLVAHGNAPCRCSDKWGRQSNVINMLNRVVSAVCAVGDCTFQEFLELGN